MRLVRGTAVGQGFIVLATPILTRLYTPAEFGTLGLFVAFLNSAGVVASCRYETAIPSATPEDAPSLLGLAIVIAIPLSFIACALLLAMKIGDFMSYGLIPTWMCVVGIPAVFASSAIESVRYWLLRARRFGDVGRILVVQGAFKAVTPVVLGVFHVVGGLVIGETVGRMVGVARPLMEALPAITRADAFHSRRRLKAIVRQYWKLPVINTPSSLADVFTNSLPVVLIATVFGAGHAGVFLLVQRVISLPTSLLGVSAADVFHVRFAELVAIGRGETRAFVNRTAVRLLLVGCSFIVPVALVAPFLARPLLGQSWTEAGVLVPVLAPWSLAAFVVSPLSRVLTVTLELQLKLVYDVIAILLLFAAVAVARARGMSFVEGILTMSVLRAFAYIVYYAVILKALPRPTLIQDLV